MAAVQVVLLTPLPVRWFVCVVLTAFRMEDPVMIGILLCHHDDFSAHAASALYH